MDGDLEQELAAHLDLAVALLILALGVGSNTAFSAW